MSLLLVFCSLDLTGPQFGAFSHIYRHIVGITSYFLDVSSGGKAAASKI